MKEGVRFKNRKVPCLHLRVVSDDILRKASNQFRLKQIKKKKGMTTGEVRYSFNLQEIFLTLQRIILSHWGSAGDLQIFCILDGPITVLHTVKWIATWRNTKTGPLYGWILQQYSLFDWSSQLFPSNRKYVTVGQ